MEKFNSYETLFIIDASLSEEAIKGLVDKFTALIAEHGKVSEVNEWGKRRLAYLIDDEADGYYVLYNFVSGPEFPMELERVSKITDGVLRSMVVRKDK